ncbi:hypothetical protein [Amnibacterium kyonggiense]
MTDDGLGDLRCPRCLVEMRLDGDAHEVLDGDRTIVEGSAWLSCPACGLVRVV